MKTKDKDYADTLVRLNAIPVIETTRLELTRQQEREWLFEDMLAMDGEATW